MSARCLIPLLVLCVPAAALAEVIVYDHFDDGVLDPAWEVTLNEFACDWTYAEQGSDLHVTEICHDGSALDWAIVSLSQPCLAPADFYVAWKFAWYVSAGYPDAMQELIVVLYDETGSAIAYGGYADAWVQYSGGMLAVVRDAGSFSSGQGSLPHCGAATVTMNRVGGLITFKWDNEVIFEAPESTPVASIAIRFYYTWYSAPDWPPIDESVDFVRVTDSAAVAAPDAIPYTGPILAGIHPNPFNPLTTITFALDQPRHAEVAIFDLTGKLLGVLADRTHGAGEHSVVWNGTDATGQAVPSGTYVVRLQTEAATQTRKVTLLR